MTLVLTLLCRDEADVLDDMLKFHFRQGVDQVIVTDNGSVDGSLDILRRFERRGRLRLLQEPEHTHDQAFWVTRMARMAATDYQASWVINSDADEFWWPRQGSLRSTLASAPDAVQAYTIERTNFLPPPRDSGDHRPFHQRQILRERQSFNSLGRPLPPKLIHRGDPEVTAATGITARRATASPSRPALVTPSKFCTFRSAVTRNWNARSARVPRRWNGTPGSTPAWATPGGGCTATISRPGRCLPITTACDRTPLGLQPAWPLAI